MYYYTAFIIAIISILILFLGLLLERRSRTSKIIVTYIICSICAVWLHWNNRTTSNLRLHEKLITADSVTLEDRTMDLYHTTKPDMIFFPRMSDAPIYIQQCDILTSEPLTFLSDGKTIQTKLLTIREAANYPQEGIIEYNGSFYCIVSTKIFYRNALFYLNKEFVRDILSYYYQE